MPKVAYKARRRDDLFEALEMLRSRGFSPIIVGDPNMPHGKETRVAYFVEIAVPDEQVNRAWEVLAEWDAGRIHDVSPIVRPLWRGFWLAVSFWVLLVVAAYVVAPEYADGMCMWSPIVAVLGLVCTGHAKSAFREWQFRQLERRLQTDVCRGCGYNLHGNVSGRCPECGTKVQQRKQRLLRRRSTSRR